MKIKLCTMAMLLASTLVGSAQTTPESQMEKLDRGLVVVNTSSGRFVSWRSLGTDNRETTFKVLRNGTSIYNVSDKTSFLDTGGNASSKYQIVTLQDGEPTDTSDVVTPWANFYKQVKLDRPAGGSYSDGAYTYSPNDCSVGDVDGDGQYEIIVKWDPSNAHDNSHSGYTGNVYLDCYELDGTKLWRIDLGVNIRAGAHYTQFMVYDFDKDGKAELICKTAPGSMDGKGNYVNQASEDATIKAANNSKDWRNSSGKVDGGQEYLTVFNGETGAAIHTIFYNPNRSAGYGGDGKGTFNWDDRSGKSDYASYGNRGERYLAGVAYLDGPDARPSAVMCRGYYTYAFLWAVDFDGKHLKQKWFHESRTKTTYSVTDANGNKTSKTAPSPTRGAGSRTMYGNGNHNMAVADVDGDGCDEIVWGSAVCDNDGHVLYATGYGHGDAMHVSDFDLSNPGLEVYEVHEGSPYGWDLHCAATGKILHSATASGDTGRGCAADIDINNAGGEMWCTADRTPRSATTGTTVGSGSPSVNFRAYWDGDLQEELLDGNKLDKWNGNGTSRLVSFGNYASSSSCNGSKATPCLVADILGDWREEVIFWDGSTSDALNIFTTTTTTNFRVPTLMHDHTYRMAVAWQNVAYNQPPHLGYYLPDMFKTRFEAIEGAMSQEVVLGDSITPVKVKWYNCAAPSIVKSIAPDGTVKTGGAVDGFTWKINKYLTKQITLEGKPQMVGEYQFIFKSGANVGDNSIKEDTLRVICTTPTGIEELENKSTINSQIEAVYTISGMKTNKNAKGINIIKYNNGRKKKVINR